MGQPPSGCGTVQMKLQEHRMTLHSHLCSAGSPEDQRESQLAKPGNRKFPNNFQLALKYLLSIEHCLLLQVFWLEVKELWQLEAKIKTPNNSLRRDQMEKKKKHTQRRLLVFKTFPHYKVADVHWANILRWTLYLSQFLLANVYEIINSSPLVITYMI